MSKFEVGDKVRVTAAYSAVNSVIRRGDEFVVTAVEREQPYPVAAGGFVFNEDELERVSKFRVGDRVRVTDFYRGGNDTATSTVVVGHELTVDAVDRRYSDGAPSAYPVSTEGNYLFKEDELERVTEECVDCDCFPQVYTDVLITVDFGEQGLIVLHEDEAQALIRELELVTG